MQAWCSKSKGTSEAVAGIGGYSIFRSGASNFQGYPFCKKRMFPWPDEVVLA